MGLTPAYLNFEELIFALRRTPRVKCKFNTCAYPTVSGDCKALVNRGSSRLKCTLANSASWGRDNVRWIRGRLLEVRDSSDTICPCYMLCNEYAYKRPKPIERNSTQLFGRSQSGTYITPYNFCVLTLPSWSLTTSIIYWSPGVPTGINIFPGAFNCSTKSCGMTYISGYKGERHWCSGANMNCIIRS